MGQQLIARLSKDRRAAQHAGAVDQRVRKPCTGHAAPSARRKAYLPAESTPTRRSVSVDRALLRMVLRRRSVSVNGPQSLVGRRRRLQMSGEIRQG